LTEIRATTRIQAPLDRAWSFIADHERFLSSGEELSCEVVEPGAEHRDGVGAVRVVRSGDIVFREAITAWEPGRRYEYRIRELTGPMGFTLPVTHLGGWLELTEEAEHIDVVWGSKFRVGLFLVGGWIERQLAGDLESAFSRLLERARRMVEQG